MIKKYCKKPVVVEAVEFVRGNEFDVVDFITRYGGNASICAEEYCIKIETLEGEMSASLGDYIIKGVNGEFYPCKPDIFMKTYEEVPKMQNKYKHFSLEERKIIEDLIKEGKNCVEIAEEIGRDKSSVYREVRRGRVKKEGSALYYSPELAHKRYLKALSESRMLKVRAAENENG